MKLLFIYLFVYLFIYQSIYLLQFLKWRRCKNYTHAYDMKMQSTATTKLKEKIKQKKNKTNGDPYKSNRSKETGHLHKM